MADGYIELTVRFAREGDQWTANCVELGTAAFGDTFEDVDEAIRDLILLHVNTLESVGERQRFFKKHGITHHRGKPKTQARPVQVRPDEMVSRLIEPLAVVG